MSATHEVTGQLAEAIKAFEALDTGDAQAMALGGQGLGDRLATVINLVTKLAGAKGLGMALNALILIGKVLTIVTGNGTTEEKLKAVLDLAKSLLGLDSEPTPAPAASKSHK
jgi:hypothetical protein